MNSSRTVFLTCAVAATFALAACGKKDEAAPAPVVAPAPAPTTSPPPAPAGASFASLTLGKAVDANQNVTERTVDFAPTDTIYAAVATAGAAPSVTIAARWTYGDGQLVDESSQTIAPTGPAVTTFHIAKPDGWPAGKYLVTITIDGQVVADEGFSVN